MLLHYDAVVEGVGGGRVKHNCRWQRIYLEASKTLDVELLYKCCKPLVWVSKLGCTPWDETLSLNDADVRHASSFPLKALL